MVVFQEVLPSKLTKNQVAQLQHLHLSDPFSDMSVLLEGLLPPFSSNDMNTRLVLATEDDKIVGWSAAESDTYTVNRKQWDITIVSVFVDPIHRKQGHGRMLAYMAGKLWPEITKIPPEWERGDYGYDFYRKVLPEYCKDSHEEASV